MGAWSYGKQAKGNLSIKWPVWGLAGSSFGSTNTNHTANLKQNGPKPQKKKTTKPSEVHLLQNNPYLPLK